MNNPILDKLLSGEMQLAELDFTNLSREEIRLTRIGYLRMRKKYKPSTKLYVGRPILNNERRCIICRKLFKPRKTKTKCCSPACGTESSKRTKSLKKSQ